jgi:hypothetical protein
VLTSAITVFRVLGKAVLVIGGIIVLMAALVDMPEPVKPLDLSPKKHKPAAARSLPEPTLSQCTFYQGM